MIPIDISSPPATINRHQTPNLSHVRQSLEKIVPFTQDVLSVLALAPDAVPKFVLENGLLLTDDDLTVAQIFA